MQQQDVGVWEGDMGGSLRTIPSASVCSNLEDQTQTEQKKNMGKPRFALANQTKEGPLVENKFEHSQHKPKQ